MIPALKAVMFDDGKEGEGGGWPPPGSGGRVTHFGEVHDEPRELGTGLLPPAGDDCQSLEWNWGMEGWPEGVVWGLPGPSDRDERRSGE